jgi:hypothetical protein
MGESIVLLLSDCMRRPIKEAVKTSALLCASLIGALSAGCTGQIGPDREGTAGIGSVGAGGVRAQIGAGGGSSVAGTAGSSVGGHTGTPGIGGGAGGSLDAGGGDVTRPDTGGNVADRAEGGTRVDATSGTGGARVDAGGAGGGVGAYSPCPGNGSPCIIMPLGDSITDGYPYEVGGYRVELFHQAVQASTPITFVGRNSNGPATVDNMPFPKGHEGYVGYDIDTDPKDPGITPLVDGAIAMFHPHIVLLQIGTNDVDVSFDLVNAPTRLGVLIDKIINDAPNALVIVAQVTPSTDAATNARILTYNAAIPAVVQQRAAAGKHVAVVDIYSAFAAHADFASTLMWDYLHPDTDGYTLLGDTWYGAIKSVLKR